jgi:hypothetical protein
MKEMHGRGRDASIEVAFQENRDLSQSEIATRQESEQMPNQHISAELQKLFLMPTIATNQRR